ncbi:MAG: hypothetical protein EXR71_17595 [Myxococcales bacterium]|nr:hypothetical protein [Myxococcales bacterium]
MKELWARLRSEGRRIAELRAIAETGDGRACVAAAREIGSVGGWRTLRRALAGGSLAPEPAWLQAAPPPRAREDHLLTTLARLRAGESYDGLRAELAALDARTVPTPGGPRAPGQALSIAPLADRFTIVGADAGVPRSLARSRLLDDERAPSRWLRLAALHHPDDFGVLLSARASAGRRGDHLLLEALGLHGDPRALVVLKDALHARDVDPGRGFMQRRLAADGLGRLGLAAAVPLLRRALAAERADFEGRPGAGLGIQYPVRANLVWALGELGSADALDDLVACLGDTSGTAFGGLYLPAMDALVRMGALAQGPLRRCEAAGIEPAATHARGVLAILAGERA